MDNLYEEDEYVKLIASRIKKIQESKYRYFKTRRGNKVSLSKIEAGKSYKNVNKIQMMQKKEFDDLFYDYKEALKNKSAKVGFDTSMQKI